MAHRGALLLDTITLFASGDSQTSATLVPVWPKALRLDGAVSDACALRIMMLEHVRRRAADFDHLDDDPFSLFKPGSSRIRISGMRRLISRSCPRGAMVTTSTICPPCIEGRAGDRSASFGVRRTWHAAL